MSEERHLDQGGSAPAAAGGGPEAPEEAAGWLPWSPDLFPRARADDCLVLLAVCCSCCHRCRVAAPAWLAGLRTLPLMDQRVIGVKIDRDDCPELAELCEEIARSLSGNPECPLAVLWTPEALPVAAAGGASADAAELLAAAVRQHRSSREQSRQRGRRLVASLRAAPATEGAADERTLAAGVQALCRAADPARGAFGRGPKRPHAPALELLLRVHQRSGDPRCLHTATLALHAMARGALCDHLGGGFHTAAGDPAWQQPRFEKRLADNAQLALVYFGAYQLTGELAFAATARETLDYLLRELRRPDGAFALGQAADLAGIDGGAYLWTAEQVTALLGAELGELACRHWGLRGGRETGGALPLRIAEPVEDLAAASGRDYASLRLALGEARARLFAARSRRGRLPRDERAPVADNAWAVRAFVRAAELFGEASDIDAARKTMSAIVASGTQASGAGVFRFLGQPRIPGRLGDHAAVVAALLDLWEFGGEPGHLERATAVADGMLAAFRDPANGGFFLGPDDAGLPLRARPDRDRATTSPAAVAIESLVRLGAATGRQSYRTAAARALAAHVRSVLLDPVTGAGVLAAIPAHLDGPLEIVVVGARQGPETLALLEQIRRSYLPGRVLSVIDPNRQPPPPLPAALAAQAPGAAAVLVRRRGTVLGWARNWAELHPLLSAAK